MHPLRCLCCSWCCAVDLVLFCTKLHGCRNREQSNTTDKYADQSRTFTLSFWESCYGMVWRIFPSVILTRYIKTFLDNNEENWFYYCLHGAYYHKCMTFTKPIQLFLIRIWHCILCFNTVNQSMRNHHTEQVQGENGKINSEKVPGQSSSISNLCLHI